MNKLIIVSSIFVLLILMIQNFKLKRNIRETEKEEIEKKIYKNSYVNLMNITEEEKLKFPIKEFGKESTLMDKNIESILLRIEVNGNPMDIVEDQYYSTNCTKLYSYTENMHNDDFSYIQGKRLEVLFRYGDIKIHSINRVSVRTIETFEVPKVIAEDFISYLENKKIEITEFIKNSELPQERKDNLKRDLDIFIKNATKEIKRSIV